jgi:hypothetical protein
VSTSEKIFTYVFVICLAVFVGPGLLDQVVVALDKFLVHLIVLPPLAILLCVVEWLVQSILPMAR